MSEREKTIAENIAKACELLPEDKKSYLLGFAEGVAAVAGEQRKATESNEKNVKGA